jgi:hypothetical protein
MSKLLCLFLEDDILGGVLSWPKRELGAKVLFYKNAHDVRRYVEAHEPDVVLLDEPCPPILDLSALLWVKQRCRLVRVVWDASDTPWHGFLQERINGNAFDAIIAADGATDWPHRAGIDHSFPTPVDPAWYAADGVRSIRLGLSGSCGTLGPRKDILGNLEADGTLTFRKRGEIQLPYETNAEFYKTCHAVLNVAHTSSGRLQCKARAIEAALAGCLLFETRGSPLNRWLVPGVHYVEYDSPEEVRAYCNRPDFHEQCRSIGELARGMVLQMDLPRRFWGKVLGEQI